MKKPTSIALAASLAVAIFFSACSAGKKPQGLEGFEKTASGLYYKMHVSNPDARKPVETDFVTGIGIYKTGDSVFFDTRSNPNPYSFPIMGSTHKGDIFEGLKMMGEGDSATFAIPADSLFLKTFRQPLPPYIDSGSMVFVDFKLLRVQSREDFEAEMQQKMEAQNPELTRARTEEPALREAWLKENNITQPALPSGLIYIEQKAGTGAQPQVGQTVQVHYTGTLLDGSKFDSSLDRGEPFSFVLGQGQVIRGWDEGIALMKEGGKARLIIPSSLGYGSRDIGTIKPYSTLVFEVELIKIGE